MYENLFPPNRLSRVYCLEAYATNDPFLGKISLAEQRYREALSVFEDILGKKHLDVAGCLCRLADLCSARRMFAASERYTDRH